MTHAPPWYTFDSFLESQGGGRAYDFVLDGSYTYYSKAEPGISDTLIMEVHGSDVTFVAYGFLVRYLLKIRENYFGESIHFQTLEEFAAKQGEADEAEPPQAPVREFTYTKTETDLDVLIYAYVNNGTIVLPCNIYSAESHIMLNFATFDTDIRFTNYYMDLQANISPVRGAYNKIADQTKLLNLSRDKQPFDPIIFIDGIVIHGNRLFGLPPTEPTYFCKWDFDLGSLLVNGPLEFTQYMDQIVNAAAYTYIDSENGLMIPEPVLYDVTYLSLKIASIRLVFKVDQTSLEVSTDTLSFEFNDLANQRYSARITISIPHLQVGVYNLLTLEDGSVRREVLTHCETSILITDFVQKRNFEFCREKQQQHIALHDAPFDRCPFLLDDNHRVNHKKPMGDIIPSIPLALVPPPLTSDTLKYIDPNMIDSLGKDFEEGDSSASSRSQFSESARSTNHSTSDSSSDDSDGYQTPEIQLNYSFKLAGTETKGNAFLPPDAWKQFEQVAVDFKEKMPGFALNPTCYYSSEEAICPTSPVDPQFEHDSFIFQLGDVTGFVSPRGLAAANNLLQSAQHQDLQSTLDAIQIHVLKNLNYIKNGKPEIKNFRISVSSVDIKYGSLTGDSYEEVRHQYSTIISHFALKCDAIAVAFRSKKMKTPQSDIGEYLSQNNGEPPTSISLYAGCQNLAIGIMRGQSDIKYTDSQGQIHHTDYQPMLLQLENPEFWFHEGTSQNSSSLRLRNINLLIMNDHVDWVCAFIKSNMEEVKILVKTDKVITHLEKTRTAYVVNALSLAGESFNIEDDPSVLTRPTFIIQASKHVRSNDSWKILVRLRHILKSVPAEWREKQDYLVQHNEFLPVNPEKAKKEVLNVFNRWRSWEMESMERSYVFRHIFNDTTFQDTLLSTTMALVVDLECIAIRLHYAEKEDFLCFDYAKLTAGWNNETQELPTESRPLNIDCSLGCSNARSSISTNMLEVYERIAPFLEELSQEPASDSPVPLGVLPEKKVPPISLSAMILIQNMSTALVTPSISCTLEMKDIETSIFLEQLDQNDPLNVYSSLTSHFNHVEFRVSELTDSYQGETVLVTFSLKDYKSSVTSSGPLMTAPKYVTFSSDVFLLLLNKPLEYIAKIAIHVIDVDYVILKPILEKLAAKKEPSIESNEVASIKSAAKSSETKSLFGSFGFPVYVKAVCNTSEIRLNTSVSWCFYIASSQTSFTASLSEAFQLTSELKLTDQEIGLLVTNSIDNDSGGVRRVTSITLPSFAAMFFFEETAEILCAEMIVMAESFEIRTLTLSSILRLVRSEMSRDEVVKTITAIKALSTKVEETFGVAKSTDVKSDDQAKLPKHKTSKPLCFNLDLSVQETVVVIPSLDSSLVLQFENIHCILRSFYRDPEVATGFVKKPIFMDLSFDDMLFVVQNDNWSVHTSTIIKVHLRLLYQAAEDKEGEVGKQKIEISSDHFQVMLCQRVVAKLIEIESYLEEGLVGLEIYSSKKPNKQPEQSEISSEEKTKAQFAALQNFADRTTFQVAFRNACFAWLFEDEYSDNAYATNPDAKGFLVGYDRLFITTKSLQGRTLLGGVYITPTFSEHDIFHSNTDKSNAANTAYLPRVELVMRYSCDEKYPLVTLDLSGDSLKISILPSIVSIVVCAVNSLTNTVDVMTKITKKRAREQHTADPIKDSAADGEIKYSLPFSFRFAIGFDGATISLWNSGDVTSTAINRRYSFSRMFAIPESMADPVNVPKNNTEPSLWLQAPAVDAVIEYSKGEGSHGRDVLNGLVQISSSTNKVYPKVMPCVMEMTRVIQDILKQSTLPPVKHDIEEEIIAIPLTTQKSGEIDLEEQFGNIIVDLRIRLAKQEIMLSCEPTALVAATVGYDGFFIGLTSSEEGLRKTSYSLSVRLAQFSASLQHIYSREVSGMISIAEVNLFVTKDRSCAEQQAILVAAKIADIKTDINIKQSQDLELFQDIWYPGNPLGNSSNQKGSTSMDQLAIDAFRQPNDAYIDGGVMRKYRRVTSTTAIPWRFDFSLTNVTGTADLGQAVGQVTFTVDKFWLSSRKTSGWEQNLVLGFDEIKLVSEGRLGGIVSLKKLQLSTAIMWQRHDGGIHPVPLVQAIIGVESLESRISFDFHSFALISISALHLSMFNQRDSNFILNDRLAAVGSCESINIYATSLAASNFLDLYYTLERMRREANASYNAILRDSARPGTEQDGSDRKGKNSKHSEFKAFEKLRTFLDFNVNLVTLCIYPDSLVDLQVFTITLRGAEARYSQEIEHKELDDAVSFSSSTANTTEKQLVCSLDMKLTELMVSLSTYRKALAKANDLVDMPISEYVLKSREAKGGTIIGIPVCDISMQTWQDYDSFTLVDYIFSSSFGGRVDVGWNLGSVTFIKGMWENHINTFSSRRDTYKMRSRLAPGVEVLRTLSSMDEEVEETQEFNASTEAISTPAESTTPPSTPPTTTFSVNIIPPPPDPVKPSDESIHSDKGPVYSYRPLKPPIIAKPQLRDMGEATPPIEWIGLHRKKLPSLTHQALIVSLQKMVEEVELVYRQVLGHS